MPWRNLVLAREDGEDWAVLPLSARVGVVKGWNCCWLKRLSQTGRLLSMAIVLLYTPLFGLNQAANLIFG